MCFCSLGTGFLFSFKRVQRVGLRSALLLEIKEVRDGSVMICGSRIRGETLATLSLCFAVLTCFVSTWHRPLPPLPLSSPQSLPCGAPQPVPTLGLAGAISIPGAPHLTWKWVAEPVTAAPCGSGLAVVVHVEDRTRVWVSEPW